MAMTESKSIKSRKIATEGLRDFTNGQQFCLLCEGPMYDRNIDVPL